MFSILTVYKNLILGCLIAALIAGAFYTFQRVMRRERERGYQEAVAEYTTKALIAEVDARRKESQLNKQILEAQHAAVIRAQENKKLSDALTVSTLKLRDATAAIRNRLPTNSAETNRNTADAALTVFGECAGEYTAMAENATGHANDVVTLSDAWPKQ